MLTAASPALAELDVGDPAPPFTITHWLTGQPEELAAGKGKKIYMLEFWATWCLPCLHEIPRLTKLQKLYRDQGVVIIGVTGPGGGRQRLSEVEAFVRTKGDSMGYTVAWDQTDAMSRNYAMALGSMGIPYTVIVDKQGRIAWHGYSSPDAERVLDELVSGTFDLAQEAERAVKEAKINELGPRYRMLAASGNWGAALEILHQMADIDPTRIDLLTETYMVYRIQVGDPARLRSWLEGFIDKHKDDALALITICKVLLNMEVDEPGERMPDLLVRAARASLDATDGKGVGALWVCARVAHQVGRIEAAISLQQQALERAPKSLEPKLTKELEYYQACKRLGEESF
jgi:thiol-disulfide isomerase/thioredoxin